MKHLLDIIKENGYTAWRYSIIFPTQNTSSKTQNEYILKNKEKFNVKFVKGNEKDGHFYFQPKKSEHDFSSMWSGGLSVFYVKDEDFENAIIWGLYEGNKPPTLIQPKLNIKYTRFDNKNEFEILNGYRQDAIEKVLKEENHKFIFDNLYTKYLFEYDTTKNPTE